MSETGRRIPRGVESASRFRCSKHSRLKKVACWLSATTPLGAEAWLIAPVVPTRSYGTSGHWTNCARVKQSTPPAMIGASALSTTERRSVACCAMTIDASSAGASLRSCLTNGHVIHQYVGWSEMHSKVAFKGTVVCLCNYIYGGS